jgi:hypothetical protein
VDRPSKSREGLTAVRTRGLRWVLPVLPFIVIAVILIGRTWAYLGFGIWDILWLTSLASISWRIRRRT